MKSASFIPNTEQELFVQTVSVLKSRFGVDDLSTFEVLRLYRNCRNIYAAYLVQCTEIATQIAKGAKKYPPPLALDTLDPVLEAIHVWMENSIDMIY